MRAAIVLLALSVSAWVSASTEISFKKKGSLIKKYSLEEFKKEFSVKTVTVNEGHEDKTVTYKGVALQEVMEKVYGGKWSPESNSHAADEILVTCIDGYQPSVPLMKALKHGTYLVYEKADGTPFTFKDKASGNVIEYGPVYLVWENIKDPIISKEGLEFWPYQVATIDLISFQERFDRLVPPGKLSPAAKRGFVAYRVQCMQCHRINGEGGNKGIELNYPASVAEYFKEPWLKKFIADPQSVRAGATMPAFQKFLPKWEQTISDIVEYLKAISTMKKAPKEGKA